MAHQRQTIREAIVTRLTGLTTSGSRVYASRLKPLLDAELPAILVSTGGEALDDATYLKTGLPVARPLEVRIDLVAKAVSGFENTVDLMLSEVEAALFDTPAHNTLSGLVHFVQLASILGPEMDDSLEKPSIRLPVILRAVYS